jgi:hypothetical protein
MLKHFAAALLCTVLATPAWAQSIKKMDAGLDAVIAPGTKIEKVATASSSAKADVEGRQAVVLRRARQQGAHL